MKFNKKGVIQNLQPLVVSLVAIGIALAVAFLILAEVNSNSTVTANSNATSAVTETQTALDDVPGWLSIIVITLIGALLIGLVSVFRGRR